MIISKIKKNLISILIIFFLIFLLKYSNENIIAVKNGLKLWINNVVPSLFPFFIATEILTHTSVINYLGIKLKKIVRYLFNVPGEGAFALIMGIICGYPTGAKIVVNLKKEGVLNTVEAERLIAFTNNSGPLFILGTVGITLLNNSHNGYYLLISHIISCLIVGIFFRNWKSNFEISNKKFIQKNNNITLSNFGEILGNSIKNSINSIVNIGGFIIFFSVIISILTSVGFFNITENIFEFFNISPQIGNGILSGMLELTNGVNILSVQEPNIINICIISFLIGFGGISVLFQVYSIISKENISIKSYFYGKLLQGIISFGITFLLLNI